MKLKFDRLAVSAIFASIATIGSALNCSVNARDIEAISMNQTHSFFGKVTVTAGNDAVRIDDKRGLGFVLVAKAPDWKISIFRDDDKSIFTEDFAEFASSGLVSEFIMTRKGAALLGPGSTSVKKSFMGFPIIQVRYPTFFEFLPLPKGSAKQIALVLRSAYRTVEVSGFPVTEITLLKQDLVAGNLMKGHKQTDLSTTSIETIKVSSDIFDAPKNYARAKSVREVVAGADSREKTDSLQDLFDFDRRAK